VLLVKLLLSYPLHDRVDIIAVNKKYKFHLFDLVDLLLQLEVGQILVLQFESLALIVLALLTRLASSIRKNPKKQTVSLKSLGIFNTSMILRMK
jgi:hypothetical protein